MLEQAIFFAAKAHDRINQRRKYTADPYIVHPLEVMGLVLAHTAPEFRTPEVLAAAVLHDTVEDTLVTLSDIHQTFGGTVSAYVKGLTDVYVSGYEEDGHRLNRAERKAKEAWRLATESPEVQTIKCADLISNTSSIVEYDPSFAKTYVPEKRRILSGLLRADTNLWTLAVVTLEQAEAKLAA